MESAPPQLAALRRFRRQLVLGNLAVFGLLLLAAALTAQSSWRAHEERVRASATTLAQTLSLNVSATLKQLDTLLLSTLQQVQRLEARGPLESAEVASILDEQRALVPQASLLRLTHGDGVVMNSDGHGLMSMADRDYFQLARADPRQLAVSEPLFGRIRQEWLLIVARARTGPDGRFNGILYTGMDTARFQQDFKAADIGPHGAVTLRSAALNLISRYTPTEPDPHAGVGTNKIAPALREALAANPTRGSFLASGGLDAVERITAYERVPGTSLLLQVGLATADYRSAFLREMAWSVSLLVALGVMVVGFSIALFRGQVRQGRALAKIDLLASERGVLLDNELVSMIKLRNRVEVWHNKAMARLFGYEPGELRGQPIRRLYPDEASYDRVGRGYLQLKAAGSFRTQLQMKRKDGSLVWIDLSGTPLPDGESLWSMVDISAVKASEEQARQLSLHDELTGLANRHLLFETLDFMRLNAERKGGRLAVCYLDLDGFKAVNDTHGHDAGDEVLRVTAQRLQGSVRANDLVARLGGDEFVVVLNQFEAPHDEQHPLQRILKAFEAPVTLPDQTLARVGITIGVALYPEHARRSAELLRLADQAMLGAKRMGKGQWVMHEPSVAER